MFENTAVPVENPVLRRLLMAVLAAAVVWVSPAYAEETPAEKSTAASSPDPKKDKADYEFGGQILTLTEPPPEVGPSDNPRFQANPDGTITDLKLNLIWIKVDSYQAEKKWMNWDQGHAYIKKLNQQKFAGADQWRLPTRKELSSLYDETKSVPWNYYWTKNE
ncbi:MAG: DUF1566 domain-containing protein, partial [Nitrospinaceae bacterium]|nr:DUF1566 domain-containing protein [Nitrospinaceae bacterium]NIR57077.1 DUF1566 domain-containing protein [Nitrospinaceae bacterium]NIS87518.1 DUF1566 domain-containing protein [Nitrospinaceae bacterium]NIT84388.1 DUF1566 domain-containing protein [Nitrospinaceae bacterium]NIU98767.1 DUF1566 domain-containing protein [Nitrospinaceae bacterium]